MIISEFFVVTIYGMWLSSLSKCQALQITESSTAMAMITLQIPSTTNYGIFHRHGYRHCPNAKHHKLRNLPLPWLWSLSKFQAPQITESSTAMAIIIVQIPSITNNGIFHRHGYRHCPNAKHHSCFVQLILVNLVLL